MNAKQELIEHSHAVKRLVKCAEITIFTGWEQDSNSVEFNLPVGYSDQDLEDFLNKLDFDYDSGFGTQYLFGDIWYTDGTWSERYEYDGSECWIHKSCPKIPDHLQ
jgi:hypothetical protein